MTLRQNTLVLAETAYVDLRAVRPGVYMREAPRAYRVLRLYLFIRRHVALNCLLKKMIMGQECGEVVKPIGPQYRSPDSLRNLKLFSTGSECLTCFPSPAGPAVQTVWSSRTGDRVFPMMIRAVEYRHGRPPLAVWKAMGDTGLLNWVVNDCRTILRPTYYDADPFAPGQPADTVLVAGCELAPDPIGKLPSLPPGVSLLN